MSLESNYPRVGEPKLPRRDWVVLPFLSIATMILVMGSTELLGWQLFPWSGDHELEHRCIVRNDPSTGIRGVPNTECWDKTAESPSISYKFNSCGHRAGMECAPKPRGTYRIVMIGSSFAMGMRAPEEQTIGHLLPAELTRETGQKIELYNEGFGWGSPHTVDLQFADVLAAQPDLILWLLTSYDIQNPTMLFPSDFQQNKAILNSTHVSSERRSFVANIWDTSDKLRARFAGKSIPDAFRDLWNQTRTSIMLRHFFYKSQSRYISAFLANSSESGYLKAQFDPAWEDHLRRFDGVAADVETRARTAGVPLVASLVPFGQHAAIVSKGKWPTGYDPYKLDDEVRQIIVRHGSSYVDILPNFRTVPNPERHYYPVDGHPNADGYTMITGFLAKALTDGAMSTLKAAHRPIDALSDGN
jgi:hypothetical protein